MSAEVMKTVLQELHAAGIRQPTVAATAKHRQVRWQSPKGELRSIVIANTSNDVRAVANARAEVRRMLRLDGLLAGSEPKVPERVPSRLELLEQRLARIEARIAELTA